MKKLFLHLLIVLVAGTVTLTALNYKAQAQQPYPELSQLDRDVATSLMNARLAMRDIAECNLPMLIRIQGILTRETNNLMRLQGWTFGKLQEMGQNLHDILSQMESLMPDAPGAETAALEGMKTALGAAGLVPGFGVIAYGASLTVSIGENYAKWHNSSQAADIAEGIKANAQQQIEAFQGAINLYNDIVAGLGELARYQARIQDLLNTYEERCLDDEGGEDGESYNFIPSPAGATPATVEDTVNQAMQDYDNCDLAYMIALNGLLTAQINNLFQQQQQLFNDLLNKNNELNEALHNLEQGLPQPPNWGWELGKAAFGSLGTGSNAAVSAGVFAAGVGTQIADLSDTIDSVDAADALKAPVRQKMQELADLVKKHEELMNILNRLRQHQVKVQNDIETWEERCTKRDQDEGTTGYIPGETGILIGSDGTEWCTYGFGGPTVVPVNPVGGGTTVTTPGGGSPVSAPPGTPDGSSEGGPSTMPPAPTTTTSIPDDEDDDPRDAPTPPGGPVTSAPPPIIPIGPTGTSQPPEEPEDEDDDPRDAPHLIVKAKQSVLQSGTKAQQAVAGQQIKLFADSTVAQPLPHTRGAKKNDADFNKPPLQCTTGKDGSCKIDLPPGTVANGQNLEANVNVTKQNSVNVQVPTPANGKPPASQLPGAVQQYATDTQTVNGKTYVTLTYPAGQDKTVRGLLQNAPNVIGFETNFCRDKQPKSAPVLKVYTHNGVASQIISLEAQ
ncbi:MAG: hypothetical protein H6867_11505 [Rhodospirillales bacterium]|nr:hypothetical protein [Rhodospirillales bacterium]MCB9996756.1 hypothetical protein [Rhodospirillales bacterium]